MRGLPANIPLGELQKQKMEAIGPTHDTGNPTIASEFFDTRQVGGFLGPLDLYSTRESDTSHHDVQRGTIICVSDSRMLAVHRKHSTGVCHGLLCDATG